jgi:hypothetical protein
MTAIDGIVRNADPTGMSLPASLKVGLKEWDVVCRALESGRQILLLRKGGIHDVEGVFQLEEQNFLLFPTFLHQKAEMLKPGEQEQLVAHAAEPERVTISAAGSVTEIVRVNRREQIDAIDDAHIWSKAQIDMRFNYKPHNPLYLMFVRTYRLPQAIEIANTVAYAGCKSWVPLEREIPTAGATPVLSDTSYETARRAVLDRVNRA